MQLRYQNFDDFIVVNKAFGYRTHRVSDGQFGLVEYLCEKLQQELFVVHRLDKETSGLMLFAKSKKAAQELSQLFETQAIQKTYFFLTDQAVSQTSLEIESFIIKEQNHYVQKPGEAPNSKTQFELVKKLGSYFLWKATPFSGKPHQIRIHARASGIPILGDSEHGGSPFFRLALHAHSLAFCWKTQNLKFESELPKLFKAESQNDYENFLNACLEKRNQFYHLASGESYRLVHTESEKIRADVFGSKLWIYDYTDTGLTDPEKKSCINFAEKNNFQIIIRHMLDRGSGVGGLETSTLHKSDLEENWTAQEEKINYILKTNAGFSPGLFLDQRENRSLVRETSADKSVLNLFCYTSGFSMAAALGNAKQTTSVDVSAKFLNWSKENFAANQLNVSQHEFFTQDSLLFLKGSVKRNRKWDLIICDPPTFGRSKDSTWKIERDLPEIANLMYQCLEKNGRILFTCNYEKMNRDELIKLFLKKIAAKVKIERLPQLSLDYEHTDDLKNLMKGFLVTKLQA